MNKNRKTKMAKERDFYIKVLDDMFVVTADRHGCVSISDSRRGDEWQATPIESEMQTDDEIAYNVIDWLEAQGTPYRDENGNMPEIVVTADE